MVAVEHPLKGVILCADDFAVHEPASKGIAQLAQQGRISATSAMVLSPRWAQDVALLQDLRGRIDVGLHLDWTSEFAVAAGHGLSLSAAMLKATLGGFGARSAAKATREVIERQLDAFEAQWKAPPDHVDGHQHVQQFAGIRQALVQALVSRYGGHYGGRYGSLADGKPYLRVSRAPPGTADLKSRVIAAMGANTLELIAAHAYIQRAGALLGMYNFAGSQADYARRMAAWLSAAPAGSIIMCHPALTHEAGDAIGAARAREFAYLSSAEFDNACREEGVQLVPGKAPRPVETV
jgi:predicted glycoside hydrolase/deacetylase ChbG (UPF0249 family)